MQCEQDPVKVTREFLKRLDAKIVPLRIPILGGVELTSRCNLKCIHCYLDEKTQKGTFDQKELSTDQWINIIDQITDAGCLYLLITGGEAMLRSDFCEIYRHACQKGLLVTVYSNGTLITDRVIEEFNLYPPYSVEISLYGASASTYEKISGVPGSFDRCMQGINKLKSNGFRFKLKTVLLTHNLSELDEVEKISDDLDVPFRFDPMIFPRFDRDCEPLNYRVPAKDAVEMDFSSRSRAEQWYDLDQRMGRQKKSSDLYQCGAGINLFYIDAFGMLRPCVMTPDLKRDLNNKSFNEIWKSEDFIKFRDQGNAPVKCIGCELHVLCGYCPGFFKLESGNFQESSDYLCEIAEKRNKAILNYSNGESVKK